ncbi:hypothetical protein JL720_10406 [Aureococcus anophagefferens]|nr:hypothetical protein JL720_10406 [Aureococcus anophagefferens]
MGDAPGSAHAPRHERTRRRAGKRRAAQQMDWSELQGLTFEEIDALEHSALQQQRRATMFGGRRARGGKAKRRGLSPAAMSPADRCSLRCWSCWRCRSANTDGAAPATAAPARASPTSSRAATARASAASTVYEDAADAGDSGGSDDDDDMRSARSSSRDMTHLEKQASFRCARPGGAREWWEWWTSDHVVARGAARAGRARHRVGRCSDERSTRGARSTRARRLPWDAQVDDILKNTVTTVASAIASVKETVRRTAKDTGEQWISKLLDNFGNQQKANFCGDPAMPEWVRSFWDKARDPWYLVFLGLKALPITQPWAFGMLLIMYDKRDDYQLINFIEEAKGLQFLTSGCLTLLFYALRLSYCTAIASPDDASDCHGIYSGSLNAVVGAVGVQAVFVMDLASHAVTVAANIFLPWIAIHLLHHPTSTSSSSAAAAAAASGASCRCTASYIMRREFGKNHVHKLLVWDVCACVASFLLVFLAFALTEKLRADVRPWMIMGGICWFRIIYSCTTFPSSSSGCPC